VKQKCLAVEVGGFREVAGHASSINQCSNNTIHIISTMSNWETIDWGNNSSSTIPGASDRTNISLPLPSKSKASDTVDDSTERTSFSSSDTEPSTRQTTSPRRGQRHSDFVKENPSRDRQQVSKHSRHRQRRSMFDNSNDSDVERDPKQSRAGYFRRLVSLEDESLPVKGYRNLVRRCSDYESDDGLTSSFRQRAANPLMDYMDRAARVFYNEDSDDDLEVPFPLRPRNFSEKKEGSLEVPFPSRPRVLGRQACTVDYSPKVMR
jgi:hypothetical protein